MRRGITWHIAYVGFRSNCKPIDIVSATTPGPDNSKTRFRSLIIGAQKSYQASSKRPKR